MAKNENDATLTQWTAAVLDELGISDIEVDIDAILDLAGEAAHGILRPAAPLTTFLVGYAAAKAVTSGEARYSAALKDAIKRVQELIRRQND